jgi:hypothetical protein
MDRARRFLGVMVPDRYHAVTAEMFELFKTSWELVRDDVDYEVILCHSDTAGREGRRLTIVSGEPSPVDTLWGVSSTHFAGPSRIDAAGIEIDLHRPWLPVGGAGQAFAWKTPRRLRLGYDLFAEIEGLLTVGQRGPCARNANTDRHLEVLRSAILAAGLPVAEIEPAPAGTSLTVALTHDVDFARMRSHVFDRTAAGFLYRATIGTLAELVRGRASLPKLRRNVAAALKLPLVYLGWASDPWNCFAAYANLDQRWRSTFYVIPRRNHPGRMAPDGDIDPTRACRYQASDVAADLTALERAGFEVGLHGIDAWTTAADATAERADLRDASSGTASGVRMHWLYFSPQTYTALESAGFDYDSTFGFNDAVGFRAGTGQVFRPLGATHLVEIPLIIQDTALFIAQRLDEDEAFSQCTRAIAEARAFGAGLTLLWHMRSIAPERCWDGFYRRLLQHLEAEGAWLAPAAEVVQFYRRRRCVNLDTRIHDGVLTIRPRSDGGIDHRLRLRVRFPNGSQPVRRLPLDGETVELAVPG